MNMNRIIKIIRKLLKDIRSNFYSNFWDIQYGNEILSFDQETMKTYNITPNKTVSNILFYIDILLMIVPEVSIIL